MIENQMQDQLLWYLLMWKYLLIFSSMNVYMFWNNFSARNKIQELSIKDIKVSNSFNYSILLGFSIKSCQKFQKYSYIYITRVFWKLWENLTEIIKRNWNFDTLN